MAIGPSSGRYAWHQGNGWRRKRAVTQIADPRGACILLKGKALAPSDFELDDFREVNLISLSARGACHCGILAEYQHQGARETSRLGAMTAV